MTAVKKGGTFKPIGGYRKPLSQFSTNIEHDVFAQGFELTTLLQDHGPITSIALSPETGKFSTTSGYNVCFFSGTTFSLERKISDFKRNCYGGSFKKNGTLFLCGSGEGLLRLYQVQSSIKNALRKFQYADKGSCAVRVGRFLEQRNHVLGLYDDGRARTFDIPTGEVVDTWKTHKERIQCAEMNSTSTLLATGSYDQTVKVWREKEQLSSLSHGAPVESVCWLGSTNLLVSAGSGKVKFWDIRNTTNSLQNPEKDGSAEPTQSSEQLSCWSKTVTCLEYEPQHNLVLAGSLDCSVRSINPNNLSVEKFCDAGAQVLSMRFLKSEQHSLVLGLGSGQIEVHRNVKKLERAVDLTIRNKKIREVKADGKTQAVKKFEHSQKVLTKHFRKFKFRRAFGYALTRWSVYDKESMEPLLNCLVELERLKALHQALGSREDEEIGLLLAYINKFLFNKPAHEKIKSTKISTTSIVPLLVAIVDLLLDLGYSNSSLYPKSLAQLHKINDTIAYEALVSQSLSEVSGVLEMFMSNM